MTHPVLKPGATAVITGGASGIGFAAAERFAALGLNVCLADLPGPRLREAEARLMARTGADRILVVPTDVSRLEEVELLAEAVAARFGGADVVMNNAGVQPGSALFGPLENWVKVIEVNLWGVIHGSRVFGAAMVAGGRPGLIINTGSKQGITTPPGDPAYNVSKAGVKAFTEALEHELRNTPDCAVQAHLFIPGFVYTPLTAHGRTERPAGAWTPEQTVDFMLERVAAGDFYILCPDNEVTRAMDERRILWAAGDVVANRPPLSRWHKDHAAAFAAFMKGE